VGFFAGCFLDISFIPAFGHSNYYVDYYDAVPQTCTSLCGEEGTPDITTSFLLNK